MSLLDILQTALAGTAPGVYRPAQLLRHLDGSGAVGVGSSTRNSSPPKRAAIVTAADRGAQRVTDRGQDLVALVVAVQIVDALEVVEVEQDHRQGGDAAAGPILL